MCVHIISICAPVFVCQKAPVWGHLHSDSAYITVCMKGGAGVCVLACEGESQKRDIAGFLRLHPWEQKCLRGPEKAGVACRVCAPRLTSGPNLASPAAGPGRQGAEPGHPPAPLRRSLPLEVMSK